MIEKSAIKNPLADLPVTIIEPSKGWISLNLRALWEYRELLYFLTWRDIKVRYKQTVLGAAWAIIQPFFTMVVFSLFFGKLARMPSDDIPYPIFAYAALVPWTFFANGLSQSSGSLVASANLIKKVYFPRLVVPISAVISGGVDFALAFVVLLGMMLFYSIVPTAAILWLPLLLLLVSARYVWDLAFPSVDCMREHYGMPHAALLPVYYVRRWLRGEDNLLNVRCIQVCAVCFSAMAFISN